MVLVKFFSVADMGLDTKMKSILLTKKGINDFVI